MTALVADASILTKCLLPESGSQEAVGLCSAADPLIAPDLVFSETANAVWKAVRRGRITRHHADRIQSVLLSASVTTLGLAALTPTALSIALEHDHPTYDCYYLAAAILHDCSLATADEQLYQLALRVGFGERAILVR